MKTKKEPIIEDGITFDSFEELHVYWWLKELKEAGYITDIHPHPKSFSLSNKATFNYRKPMKKVQDKKVPKLLIRPHEYTCDFLVEWNDLKSQGILTNASLNLILSEKEDIDLIVCHHSKTYFEVKPSFDQNNMTRLAIINQKWVFDKLGIFVEIVIPEKLFKQTFIPLRYLTGNKSNKPRKIKFPVRLLKEYVESRELLINQNPNKQCQFF